VLPGLDRSAHGTNSSVHRMSCVRVRRYRGAPGRLGHCGAVNKRRAPPRGSPESFPPVTRILYVLV